MNLYSSRCLMSMRLFHSVLPTPSSMPQVSSRRFEALTFQHPSRHSSLTSPTSSHRLPGYWRRLLGQHTFSMQFSTLQRAVPHFPIFFGPGRLQTLNSNFYAPSGPSCARAIAPCPTQLFPRPQRVAHPSRFFFSLLLAEPLSS